MKNGFTNVAQTPLETLQQPPERPLSVKIFVTNRGIAVHNGSPNSHDPTKVWARPGGKATFVIENHDAVAHEVRIPIKEFEPSKKREHQEGQGPRDPLVDTQTDTINLQPGEVGGITLAINPIEYFGFKTREPWKSHPFWGMTYKYNIYTRPKDGREIGVDPDIEIKP